MTPILKKMNREIMLKFLKKTVRITYQLLYRVGMATAGSSALVGGIALSNPIIALSGASVVASAVSACVKDSTCAPLMKIVNTLAVNTGKAKNDNQINKE